MIESIQEAFKIIDTQRLKVPFEAIRYLRRQPPSPEITEKIVFSLTHAYDDTYYDEKEDWEYEAPLWYAVVAEKHLSEDLIDLTISLFTTTEEDWDYLAEQGEWLIGKLAEKYPDLAVNKVTKAIDKLVTKKSQLPYLFLYDAFYFADLKKYKKWLLETVQNKNLYWLDTFAGTIADLQIKEAIPIFKELLKRKHLHFTTKGEIEYSLEELETGIVDLPEYAKPYFQRRKDWEVHYQSYDHSEEEELPVAATQKSKGPKIGRNDPCPCGSGKKYKECCLNK